MSSDDGHLGLVKVLALKEAARTGGEPVAHTAQWAVYPIESSARSALTVLGDPTWTCGAWPTTFLPLMSQCLTVTVRCAVPQEQVADTQHCLRTEAASSGLREAEVPDEASTLSHRPMQDLGSGCTVALGGNCQRLEVACHLGLLPLRGLLFHLFPC